MVKKLWVKNCYVGMTFHVEDAEDSVGLKSNCVATTTIHTAPLDCIHYRDCITNSLKVVRPYCVVITALPTPAYSITRKCGTAMTALYRLLRA